MKAPEKIYIDDFGSELSFDWHTEHCYEKDIEYTRTDAFIEKAYRWLDSNFTMSDTMSIVSFQTYMFDSIEEMFEDFKNYMKGE